MNVNDLQIAPRLRAMISPHVLQGTVDRIMAAEDAETTSSYPYSRYLATHADHLLEEAIRRGHGNQQAKAA